MLCIGGSLAAVVLLLMLMTGTAQRPLQQDQINFTSAWLSPCNAVSCVCVIQCRISWC